MPASFYKGWLETMRDVIRTTLLLTCSVSLAGCVDKGMLGEYMNDDTGHGSTLDDHASEDGGTIDAPDGPDSPVAPDTAGPSTSTSSGSTGDPGIEDTEGPDADSSTDGGSADTGGDLPHPSDTESDEATFAAVEQILGPTCRDTCHQPGGFWGVFDLTGDLHAKIVGVVGPLQGPQCNLVEPGNPDASYLFRKLTGTHEQACGGSGMQMPLDPNLDPNLVTVPLPQDQIDLIEAWILAGAPN